jgi:hypothetical protein
MNEYKVSGLYFLKIDTEGHDWVILKHFLKNNKCNQLLPHKIIFESNILSNPNDTSEVINILTEIGYDLISSGNDTEIKLNLNKIKKKLKFSNQIPNYYLKNYPNNYDPNNLPHKNTLEDAKEYCIKHKCTGITYQYNRYEVRIGKYLKYYDDPKLLSWVLL